MMWPIINTIASAAAALIIAYKLICLHQRFNLTARIGMGLIGGGLVLTIGPILSTAPTPFEDWSGTMVRIGLSVYFIGQMLKRRQHSSR